MAAFWCLIFPARKCAGVGCAVTLPTVFFAKATRYTRRARELLASLTLNYLSNCCRVLTRPVTITGTQGRHKAYGLLLAMAEPTRFLGYEDVSYSNRGRGSPSLEAAYKASCLLFYSSKARQTSEQTPSSWEDEIGGYRC